MHDVAIPVPGGAINVWHRPAGAGSPTAILVHGLSGTSRWWSRVIEALPNDMGIIAHDVRGRGASHTAPPPFDLATSAEDIARSLDQFHIDSAIVAGYSMGAWVVSLFATQHPDRVDRLILVDGGLPIPADPALTADEVIEAVVGPSLARLDITFPDVEAFFDYWKEHPALADYWDEAMRPALEYELHPTEDGHRVRINPEAIRESARQITVDPTTNAAAREIELAAHLIVVERGTADQDGGMIPLQSAQSAAEEMPNFTMEYLEGLNHYTLVLGDGHQTVASRIAGV